MEMDLAERRKRYLDTYAALKVERSSWDPHLRDLAANFRPRRARFQTASDIRNAGSKRNEGLVKGAPLRAVVVTSNGMAEGITSPARPWFNVTLEDPDLAKHGPVRLWLNEVRERIRMAFIRSNFYRSCQELYMDLAIFGTAVMFIDEDLADGIRCYVFPPGQYTLASSETFRIDTLYRETVLSVRQTVQRFGIEQVSPTVRDAFRLGRMQNQVPILHAIEPNLDYQTGRLGVAGKPFRSCWLELGGASNANLGFLRDSGYNEQPFAAPRWITTSEDTYGESPAMQVLGDARALQLLGKKGLLGLEKLVDPPLKANEALRGTGAASLVPGDITWLPDSMTQAIFEPVHTVDPRGLEIAEAAADKYELAIKQALYNDLFLLLTGGDARDITAREVEERHEEKMEQLGTVLNNLQDEFLDPAIERTYAILLRNGELPPPPDEIQGQKLKIEHVSILAQALKLYEAQPMERAVSFVGSIASLSGDRTIFQKLNLPKIVDSYAVEHLGLPPDLLRTEDEFNAIVAQQQQQAAQAQQQQALLAATQGAKNLGAAKMGQDNALDRMSDVLRGGNSVGQA